MDVYIAAAKSRPGVAVGLPVSYQTLLRVTDSGGVTLVEGGVAVEGLARFSAELGGGTAVQNLVADPNTGECIPGTRLLRGTEAARFVPGYGRRGDKIAELVVLSPAVSSAEQLQERAFGLFAGCTERPWQWGEGLYALLQADVLATASWQVDCVVAQAVASLTRSGMPSITDRLLDEARVLSQRAFVERMFRRMAR